MHRLTFNTEVSQVEDILQLDTELLRGLNRVEIREICQLSPKTR